MAIKLPRACTADGTGIYLYHDETDSISRTFTEEHTFRVDAVNNALTFLKHNNPLYSDIDICDSSMNDNWTVNVAEDTDTLCTADQYTLSNPTAVVAPFTTTCTI